MRTNEQREQSIPHFGYKKQQNSEFPTSWCSCAAPKASLAMAKGAKGFDQELREFFAKLDEENFARSDVKKIYRPLVVHLRWKMVRKYSAICLLIGLLWALAQVSVINWNLVAVGRLLLIKLLPLWNWTHLHNAKCLIDHPVALPPNADDHVASEKSPIDCSVCENIGIQSSAQMFCVR